MKTNKIMLNFGLSAILALALFPCMADAQQETKKLHGHVPPAVSQLHLQPTGKLSSETSIDLAIGLPLRNTDVLSNLLQQTYDPASPNYHHYLTPEQFTEQFGPSEEDYQALVNFANANKLIVRGTHANRMLLDVRGKASDVEKAFQVNLKTYQHPTENRTFYAPDSDPVLPANLSVLNIEGLDNYREAHPRYKFKSAVSSGTSKATTGSGPGNNYIGNDFRRAYVPGSSLNGTGQSVALVEFDGYFSSDITEYEGLAGLPNILVTNVLLDGFSGAPSFGADVEVCLDIDMAISMATNLTQVVVYEGTLANFLPDDVLNRIAVDNSCRQISCSWGWSGGPSPITDQIFQEMDLQGQTFYNAVGDSDAFTPGEVDNPNLPTQPEDSPYITEVGGTTLTMNGLGVSYSSETVWNWDIRYGPIEDGVGTCGGISSFYPIPSWQTNINMTSPQGSTTFRNMPDVALTADDVFVISDGGVFYSVGGTSCAAPLWAGFTALVNQQATNSFLPPVGFINPALYAIGKSANYTNCFHDITTGNNTWSQSPSLFFAVTNYDLCTGLGTPNGTNLINVLTAAIATGSNSFTHLSAPLPPYNTTLGALNGANPNGNWYLFVQDDQVLNGGMISNGWSITLTTANPIGYVADNSVTMIASTTNLATDGDVIFSIGVTNFGPSTASNVVVQDTFPNGFSLVSNNASQGTILPNGAGIVWSVGNLANSAGAQLNLTLQAPNAAESFVVNSATVTATTSDQNPVNDNATVTLNVANISQPQMAGAEGANGKFLLSISGSGFPVIVQASTNLVNWVNISTNTPPFIFTDTVTAGFPYRFYRALVQ